MKRNSPIKIILIILLLVSSYNSAQVEESDSIKTEYNSPLSDKSVLFNLDEFNLYQKIYSEDLAFPVSKDPNTMWLWTSAAISNASSENSLIQSPGNISGFLYQKYLKDSEFNPVRYVLGMAQLGAVGYLAYKHIKKYGFLK